MKITKLRARRISTVACEYCGGLTARPRRLNHIFGKRPNLIVLANVETMVCSNCRQSYLVGKALKMVGEVLAHPDQYAHVQPISIHFDNEADTLYLKLRDDLPANRTTDDMDRGLIFDWHNRTLVGVQMLAVSQQNL